MDSSAFAKPYGRCVIGAYRLQLFCANEHPFQFREAGEFTGDNANEAHAKAIAAGWSIHKYYDMAFCPTCVSGAPDKRKQ